MENKEMITNQDIKILYCLIEEDNITSYELSKRTQISVPQINYRLEKLLNKVILPIERSNGSTRYIVHEIFKDTCIDKIEKHLTKISEIIFEHGNVDIEGLRTIMSFLAVSMEFS